MPIQILSEKPWAPGVNDENAKNMIDFATKLINRSYTLRKRGSKVDERVAILHLDHATELLMKAYLIKENHPSIQNYLDEDRTVGFSKALTTLSTK